MRAEHHIVGRNERAICGFFQGQVCYATTPGFDCDFTDGRFSSALE